MENRPSYAIIFKRFWFIIEYYFLKLLRDLLYLFPISYYSLLIDISESIMSWCAVRGRNWMEYIQCNHSKENSFVYGLPCDMKNMYYRLAAYTNHWIERIAHYLFLDAQHRHRRFMIRFMNQIECGAYPFMSIPEIKRKAFVILR